MSNLSSKTIGYTLAAIVAIIANTLLTFAKETYEPLNAAMKSFLGHHWITHGVVVVALFFVLGFVFSKWLSLRSMHGSMLAISLPLAVIISGTGLFLFFLVGG